MMGDMRALILLSVCLAVRAQAQLNDLEKNFQQSLAGVTLEGQSTREGKPGVSDDKYTIEKVEKETGDTWVFYARVEYKGKGAVTLPLRLQVKWAGDTPVVTLTDTSLPGMGTYTARVLFYQGHYAGTWSGKTGGGKVFGKIVKNP